MLNVTPNQHYWGGSKGVTQSYIKGIGRTGIKILPKPFLFRILNQAVEPFAQQIEAKYPTGFITTHFRRLDNMGNPTGRWLLFTGSVKQDIIRLKSDPGYKKAAQCILGNYCLLVNQKYAQLLNGLIQNKLI